MRSAHFFIHTFSISGNGMGFPLCTILLIRWVTMCHELRSSHVVRPLRLVVTTELNENQIVNLEVPLLIAVG